MLVYRVAQKPFAGDLTGEGARIAGGRWNPKGLAVIYTSDHPALAMLEVLAYLETVALPPELQLVTISVPDDATIYAPAPEELPITWDARPHKPSSADFGAKWVREGIAAILKVPSVMTPYGVSCNLLLNPSHPELTGKLTATSCDWDLDTRIAEKILKATRS